jgi:hypothetical protein
LRTLSLPQIQVRDILNVQTAASSNTTNATTGSVTLTLGLAESGEVTNSSAELWSPPGIISAPLPPAQSTDNINASQVLCIQRGDQNIAFATRDTRSQFAAGNIQPGETYVYATGSEARTGYKLDGSVTNFTKNANGESVYSVVSPTSIEWQAPFGQLIMDATGLHYRGCGVLIDIGAMNIPAISALGLNSYVSINAGTIMLKSPAVMLGIGPVFNQAVVPYAPSMVAGQPIPPCQSTPCTSVYISLI